MEIVTLLRAIFINLWDAGCPAGNSILIRVWAVAPSGLGAVFSAGLAALQSVHRHWLTVNARLGAPSCLRPHQPGVVWSCRCWHEGTGVSHVPSAGEAALG